MSNDKVYTVTWEGTVPYRATKHEAVRDLWIAKFTGASASINTALDPGILSTDDLSESMFKLVKAEIQEEVFAALEKHKLDELCDLIAALYTTPQLVEKDGNLDHHIEIESVEAYATVKWGFTGPVCDYTVGQADVDWNEALTTRNKNEAAIRICVLAFEEKLRHKLRHS